MHLEERDTARFWAKVDKTDNCWNWTASTAKGYGQFKLRKKMVKAHRLSWFMHHGQEPPDCVCHTCDNPLCVNPAHLWIGSNTENTADKVAKNRQARGQEHQAKVATYASRGTDLPHAKLDEAKVAEVRQLKHDGWTRAAIARRYGVSPQAIGKILDGRSWGHVPHSSSCT